MAEETGGLGTPGRPVNRRSPFMIGMLAAFGVAVAYGLIELIIGARSVRAVGVAATQRATRVGHWFSGVLRQRHSSSGSGCLLAAWRARGSNAAILLDREHLVRGHGEQPGHGGLRVQQGQVTLCLAPRAARGALLRGGLALFTGGGLVG